MGHPTDLEPGAPFGRGFVLLNINNPDRNPT
jgi:hypothetical protein